MFIVASKSEQTVHSVPVWKIKPLFVYVSLCTGTRFKICVHVLD